MAVLTRESVYQDLTTIFYTVFDDESIVLNDLMTAADLERWDSLNHINLVVATEQKFGIKFRTAEVTSFENVGHFVDTILTKLASKS